MPVSSSGFAESRSRNSLHSLVEAEGHESSGCKSPDGLRRSAKAGSYFGTGPLMTSDESDRDPLRVHWLDDAFRRQFMEVRRPGFLSGVTTNRLCSLSIRIAQPVCPCRQNSSKLHPTLTFVESPSGSLVLNLRIQMHERRVEANRSAHFQG